MKFLNDIVNLWNRTNLMFRIAAGIVLGAILALVLPGYEGIGMLGTLFVGALKAVAPVLVFVLVVSSVARAREGLGGRFRKVVMLYMMTTLLAAMLAVFASRIFPVTIMFPNVGNVSGSAPGGLSEVLMNIVTGVMSNPLKAIMEANYLSILMWAVISGLALKKLAGSSTLDSVKDWADAVSQVVQWVIQCAPFGIMGLVYNAVSESGLEIFTTYGRLLLLLVGCMCVVSMILNPAVVACLIKANPYPLLWQCLKESGVSAFFTRSSAANIPVNMALCKRLGVDEDFYSVSIPLGSTINMNGAAVTITVMTLATCNTLGIEVTLWSALLLSIMATLAACGASGVAGGSLLLIPMACSLFGVGNDVAMQVVAVGFIIGVIQDSVETALNSSADALFTIATDMHEKKKSR